MRFNCHAHVFTFKSLFTERTLKVLLNRLSNEKWPDFIVEAVARILKKLIKGEYLDEEALLKELVEALSISKSFKDFLEKVNKQGDGVPAGVGIIVDGDLDDLAVGALRELLAKVGSLIKATDDDAAKQGLDDLIAFLAEGIRPTIAEVTDRLIKLSGDDTAVVALMMDITDGGTGDEGLFIRQVEDTSRAALAYPGRILPFFAVNTLRKSHFERMERALLQQGFLGVKLYPSLGYRVDSPEMDRVCAFCVANDVPLLMHCNHGGFFYKQDTIPYADPAAWRAILTRHPKLRICFGHFGGDENLTQPNVVAGSWTATILELMREFEGVYADISYHTDAMNGGDAETNYFNNLAAILDDDVTGERVLFGSDFYLVRLRLREDNLWRYFTARFSAKHFKRITETNPPTFLGLPKADGTGVTRNVTRHLDWLYEHRNEVGAEPPAWVTTALELSHGDADFQVNHLGWRWSPNNEAHFRVWRYFQSNQMYPVQQSLDFTETGGLLVRQMRYWNKEHEAPEIFQRKCQAVAEAMNATMVGAGTNYEAAFTRKNVEPALAKLLANGNTRLADLAVATDRMFRFNSEAT